MATLSQIRNQVDAWLAALWPKLVVRQQTYHASHGRYFQGLPTSLAPPADSATVAPDNLTARPHYQAEGWADVLKSDLPAVWPCSVRVDQYRGPSGDGWVATVQVRVLGKVYSRSRNYGPETWWTQPWHQMVQPDLDVVARVR